MSDMEYTWDRPKVYLTAHEVARLEILRGKLEGRRQESPAAADPAAVQCPTEFSWDHAATCEICATRIP